jgi:hypothetical protein
MGGWPFEQRFCLLSLLIPGIFLVDSPSEEQLLIYARYESRHSGLSPRLPHGMKNDSFPRYKERESTICKEDILSKH